MKGVCSDKVTHILRICFKVSADNPSPLVFVYIYIIKTFVLKDISNIYKNLCVTVCHLDKVTAVTIK